MNVRGLRDFNGVPRKDDDEDKTTHSFAGGEKSGLAIENPNPRQSLPWEKAISNASLPPGTKKVTLYKNGFQFDDEEFRSLDDPQNSKFVEDLTNGLAPKELREGASGPIHIAVDDKSSEVYQPPPSPKYTLFSGEGHALSRSKILQTQAVDASASQTIVDPDSPTTEIQFRLHDGTRVTQAFNHTHTVGDLHEFVMRVAPVGSSYSLLSGFPPRPIPEDTSLTLKSAGLLSTSLTQKVL